MYSGNQVGLAIGISAGDKLWVFRYILEDFKNHWSCRFI
ncbi:unnamed protein product, partial [Vitis vinifera]|uniref:Uncharacterized protein n=1 Tax=Vitis vinifera TaxID=29760 RepID=E0CW10_VITVI